MSGTTINILSRDLELTVSCKENGDNYVDQKPYEFILDDHLLVTGAIDDPIDRTYTTPSKQGTHPSSQGGISANISSFSLALCADTARLTKTWGTGGPGMFGAIGLAKGGYSRVKSSAKTQFSTDGNLLDLNLEAYSTPDTNRWSDFDWTLTLTDLTTTTILLDCARPNNGGSLTEKRQLSVDPTHIYALSLCGSAFVSVGDLIGRVDAEAQFTVSKSSAAVPEVPSTLGLLMVALSGISTFFHCILTSKRGKKGSTLHFALDENKAA